MTHSICARHQACTTQSLTLRRVEANKFADWTQEEFEALVLPNRRSPIEAPTLQSMQRQGASIRVHQPALAKTMLPSTVDWRGTPADSPVKDQAACGSCWVSSSFSSIVPTPCLCRGIPPNGQLCFTHFRCAGITGEGHSLSRHSAQPCSMTSMYWLKRVVLNRFSLLCC